MFTLSIVNTVSAESNQGIDANSGPRINRESSLAFSAVQKRFLLKSMRASARGKHGRALYYIQKIKLSSNQNLERDFVNLSFGRIYFNQKRYKKSLQSYEQIDRQSLFWIESVEERIWNKIYLGRLNDALADSMTLMSPLFNDIVSPEAYFASAFTAYQLCDFERVFKIVNLFKKEGSKKLSELERVLAKSKKMTAAKVEHALYADVINRLLLIETDSVQRLYLDKSLNEKRTASTNSNWSSKEPYSLEFPYEEDDVWIDEVDHLKAQVKNCPMPIKKVVSL
ncbi:MAG: hypothetical protein KDD50_00250 [Bdellovibrionales bacterium]|nr:hypothetical protein [Bdellovibrionales bacterium]